MYLVVSFQVKKDQLVYADLDVVAPRDSNPEPTIHGTEDRVEYATLDWVKMNQSMESLK